MQRIYARITFKTALTTFQFQENPSLWVNTAESFIKSSPSFGATSWNKHKILLFQLFQYRFNFILAHSA